MTNLQKINSAVFGLIMVATAVIMAIYPKDAYEFVVFFMAIGFKWNVKLSCAKWYKLLTVKALILKCLNL